VSGPCTQALARAGLLPCCVVAMDFTGGGS
jgi:hypothetical protein